jgi:hypothetical protein
MTAKKRSTKAVANVPDPPPTFTPRKEYPIGIDPTASQADNAKAIAKDILSAETAALRVIQAAEGKSGLSAALDVPGALHELRRQGAELNSGDLSRVEAMLVNQATALQSLFVRLIERGMAQESLPQYEAHMRLALKAQAQSRLAIETIGALKHGPAIFARQANVTNGGPMQVNNNAAPPTPLGAGEIKTSPSKLLEARNDLDTGTPPPPSPRNPQLEAV